MIAIPSEPPVIFLDIDGVLNGHHAWPNGYCGIDPACAGRLNAVLAKTGAHLVISSAWRYLVPEAMSLAGFETLLLTHGLDCRGRILGVTPRDEEIEPRGLQIRHWLNEHGGNRRYVVLDDLDPGISAAGHPFVRTKGNCGLTWADAQAAMAILLEKGGT